MSANYYKANIRLDRCESNLRLAFWVCRRRRPPRRLALIGGPVRGAAVPPNFVSHDELTQAPTAGMQRVPSSRETSPLSGKAIALLENWKKRLPQPSPTKRRTSVGGSSAKRKTKNQGIHKGRPDRGTVLRPRHNPARKHPGELKVPKEMAGVSPPRSDQEPGGESGNRVPPSTPSDEPKDGARVPHHEGQSLQDRRLASHGDRLPVHVPRPRQLQLRIGASGDLVDAEELPRSTGGHHRGADWRPDNSNLGIDVEKMKHFGLAETDPGRGMLAMSWLEQLQIAQPVSQDDQIMHEMCRNSVYNTGDLTGVDLPKKDLQFWIRLLNTRGETRKARLLYIWQLQNTLFGSRLNYLRATFPELFHHPNNPESMDFGHWPRFFTEKDWHTSLDVLVNQCRLMVDIILLNDPEGRLVLHLWGAPGTGKSTLAKAICGPWQVGSLSNLQMAAKSEFIYETCVYSSITMFDEPLVNVVAGQELRKFLAGDTVFANAKYESPASVVKQPVIVTSNTPHYGPFLGSDAALDRRRRLVTVSNRWKFGSDSVEDRRSWKQLYRFLFFHLGII